MIFDNSRSLGRVQPQDQTNEEWLADYEKSGADQYRAAKGFESEPKSQPKKVVVNKVNNRPSNELYFCYVDHRTTRQGSVAMDFESLDGEVTATAFFNVKIMSSRGIKYPTGKRGQFIPNKGGKFRKLWEQAVGKDPYRWCRVHKSMRSHFRGIVFVGEIEEVIDSKGKGYYKLTNVKPRK